jgi:hypothetical protein
VYWSGACPDDHRSAVVARRERAAPPVNEVDEIVLHGRGRQGVPLEIERLVDHAEIEVLGVGDADKEVEAAVQSVGAFPRGEEAADAGALCLPYLVPQHVGVVAAVPAGEGEVLLGAAP